MKSIAITQPNYIPWIGYFALLDRIDTWIALDNVQLTKRSFIVRNRIKSTNGECKWLSLSIVKSSRDTLISESELLDSGWWVDHWNLISSYYQGAEYFDEYKDEIRDLLIPRSMCVASYNIKVIVGICDILGISVEFKKSSDLISKLDGDANEKILKLCEIEKPNRFYNFQNGLEQGLYNISDFEKMKIKVFKQDYSHPKYKQVNGPFLSHLSILDLLFNSGPLSLEIIRRGNYWVNLN